MANLTKNHQIPRLNISYGTAMAAIGGGEKLKQQAISTLLEGQESKRTWNGYEWTIFVKEGTVYASNGEYDRTCPLNWILGLIQEYDYYTACRDDSDSLENFLYAAMDIICEDEFIAPRSFDPLNI